MGKVLVSCVGGRPLPNVLFILNEKPDVLYLISSRDSAKAGGNKEKLINALPEQLKPSATFDVAPYKMEETIGHCREIIDKHPQDQITFQLSSEPTTMSLGVFDIVSKQEKRTNLKLYYSSRDGLVDVINNKEGPKKLRISIENYFRVYGWEVTFQQRLDKCYDEVLRIILENIDVSHRLLGEIRKKDRGKGKRTLKTAPLKQDELALLHQLQANNIVSNVRSDESGAFLTIEQHLASFLLTGDWLEYLVFRTAGEISGYQAFDEMAWNVKDIHEKGELDFVGIKNGQLVIASCKTEQKIESKPLKELSARADQLGKGMCTKLFVTSSPPPDDTRKQEQWQEDYNTRLVYGSDLPNLKQILIDAIGDRGRI